MADFQPHFKAVVQHLPHLQQVLQLQPPPQVHQSSSSTPQPAVGSHRVWACNILHMLLLHNNPAIDKAIADAGLLPLVVAMALQYGHCSAVQCRAVEMLRSSLRSSVLELWQGLFTPGYGQQLQQSGSNNLLPPLHTALVESGGYDLVIMSYMVEMLLCGNALHMLTAGGCCLSGPGDM